MKYLYLDNSATTKPCIQAIQAVCRAMEEDYFNPSALYAPSLQVEKQMTRCRDVIKQLAGAEDVIFTSGGTEANALAICGQLNLLREKGDVLVSSGEHPSVLESARAMEALGFQVREIPYTSQGLVDLDALAAMLHEGTRMVCVMQVNNETGAVQPLKEIGALIKKKCPHAFYHVDGVQGFLRVPFSMREVGCTTYSLSGHKIHAPKGIGALCIPKQVRFKPLLAGGGQEQNRRSGTENTPGIAGLLAAIEAYPQSNVMQEMKLRLYAGLRAAIPSVVLNGPDPEDAAAAPHILNLSFAPVRAETLLHALEGEGVLVGNGSACSSKKKKISHVLKAMGVKEPVAECALRFSLNPAIREEDIDRAIDAVCRQYEIFKAFRRR